MQLLAYKSDRTEKEKNEQTKEKYKSTVRNNKNTKYRLGRANTSYTRNKKSVGQRQIKNLASKLK